MPEAESSTLTKLKPIQGQWTNRLRPVNEEPRKGQSELRTIQAAKKNNTPLPSRRPAREARQWHRIVNGDTLRALSTTYYGAPNYDMLIFEANRRELLSPNILPIGQELLIPQRPTTKSRRK